MMLFKGRWLISSTLNVSDEAFACGPTFTVGGMLSLGINYTPSPKTSWKCSWSIRSVCSIHLVHSVSLFGPFCQFIRSIRSHCSVHSVNLFGPFVPVFRPFGQSVRSIRTVCSAHSVPLFGPFGQFVRSIRKAQSNVLIPCIYIAIKLTAN